MNYPYSIKYSKFTNKYLVINYHSKLAQSSWNSYSEAKKAAYDLNRSVASRSN